MKRWRSRKVLAAAGALVAAAAAGVAALLLVSGGPAHGQAALEKGADFFASPSKNIQCGHFPSAKLVGCRTNNNDRTAFVPLTRRPYALPHPPSGYAALFSRATRGLGYGRSWLARGDFRCDSADSGMTCRSVRSRRGFKICREGIDILPSQAGKRTFCYRR